MLDMEMVVRLLEALPDHVSLVLLGDRGQLASVEAGAVLANLCPLGDMNQFSREFTADLERCTEYIVPVSECPAPLLDHMVELRRSFRFDDRSGIGRLSALVRDGRVREVERVLEDEHPDLFLRPCPESEALRKEFSPLVRQTYLELGVISPDQAFGRFESLRLLSPVRQGPRGTEALNALVRNIQIGRAHV